MKIDIIIRLDTDSGTLHVTGPEDHLVTLDVLLGTQRSVIQQLVKARQKAKNGVVTAPASALRALK